MADIVPTPETLRRIDSGFHFLSWLMPHLSGDGEDRETALVMVMANMHEKYVEGLRDAAEVLRRLSEARPSSHELRVAAKALADLEHRHRNEPVVSL